MRAILLLFQLVIAHPKSYSHYGLRDTTNNWIVLHSDESCSPNKTLSYLRRTNKSYHYYIDRTGKIYNLVDVVYQAKHAGWSHYQGLWHWNVFAIGIAFNNCIPEEYTNAQYESGKLLVKMLKQRYPDITNDRIVTHRTISWWRGKTDPKNFDVSRVFFP